MTQPTDIFSAYDASGTTGVGKSNRESLADKIWDISPTDTPVVSAIAKIKAKAVLHEWQEDALASASVTGAVEGDDLALTAPTATTRLGNRTHIVARAVGVTGTQEAVDQAGIKSRLAYEVAKKVKEVKNSIEAIVTDNNALVAGNDSTAREMAGLPSWLKDNYDKASGGTLAAGTGADAYTPGTARAFTEAQLKSVLRQCYVNGGSPSLIICSPFNKQVMSSFTGNATRFDRSEDKRLTSAVDVYVHDFGESRIVADRFSETDMVYCLDPEMLALAELRPLQVFDLAKSGDSMKKQVVWEGTLQVSNRKAHGMVFDVTNS